MNSEEKCALIATKIGEILEILGVDAKDPALHKTPQRIAHMYVHEVFATLHTPTLAPISLHTEPGSSEQAIVIKKIQVNSFCAHHFIPMIGFAEITYYPANDQIIGLSHLHRIVQHYARKPQLQERLTYEIANGLTEILGTEDLAVTLRLRHCCVMARAGEDIASETETSISRGRCS